MTNDALISMNKVQKHLKEIADNARDNGYSHEVEVIQSVQDNLLDFVEESRAALAPVDVEGLKRELQKDVEEKLQEQEISEGIDFQATAQFWRRSGAISCLHFIIEKLAAQGHLNAGWQPIETAPKDGTWIMVYWPTMGIGQYPFVVFWDEGWQPARYSDRDYGEAFPTHWMPLPAAPKKEGV